MGEAVQKAIALLMSVSQQTSLDEGQTFGEVVKAARKAQKLSLQEVADACGCTKSHMWDIEQEKSCNPSARFVWLISQALCIDPLECLKAAARSYNRKGALNPATLKDQT